MLGQKRPRETQRHWLEDEQHLSPGTLLSSYLLFY